MAITLLKWLPALALLIVAAHQRIMVYYKHQSAWKGGGFGMFSEINRHSVVATLIVKEAQGEIALRVDQRHRWDPGAAPTPENLLRWGKEILLLKWTRVGNHADIYPSPSPEPPLHVLRVTIQHFEIDLDLKLGEYSSVLSGRLSVDA